MSAEPAAGPDQSVADTAAPAAAYRANLVFTGQGTEYLRIWLVNLLLTLLTLGVYSPWAKVRKTKYFRQNTSLDGHVFDYHGNPRAILRGRLIALVLLAAYTWAFEFSLGAGLATVLVLSAAGPWLFMRALQFSLANTSYRGIRFGFEARIGDAYRTVLPVVAAWLVPSLGVWVTARWFWGGLIMGLLTLVVFFAIPAMHHRIKAYQRRHTTYGAHPVAFTPALGRFYAVYAKCVGLVALASIPVGLVVAFFTALVSAMDRPDLTALAGAVGVGAATVTMYAVGWPYLTARLQQIACRQIRLGDIRFHTDISALTLFGLVLRNLALTIVTAGLYWPLAAVALARYRLECVTVESSTPLSILAAGVQASSVSATGEGVTEMFGFDIGL